MKKQQVLIYGGILMLFPSAENTGLRLLPLLAAFFRLITLLTDIKTQKTIMQLMFVYTAGAVIDGRCENAAPVIYYAQKIILFVVLPGLIL